MRVHAAVLKIRRHKGLARSLSVERTIPLVPGFSRFWPVAHKHALFRQAEFLATAFQVGRAVDLSGGRYGMSLQVLRQSGEQLIAIVFDLENYI